MVARMTEGSRSASIRNSVLLTEAKIKALQAPQKGQVEICDTLVPGLRIRVGVSGAKSFVLRKRVAGKYRNITLGRYSERLPLTEARKKSRQILSDVEFKADPVATLPKPQKRRVDGHTVNALWPSYKKAAPCLRQPSTVAVSFISTAACKTPASTSIGSASAPHAITNSPSWCSLRSFSNFARSLSAFISESKSRGLRIDRPSLKREDRSDIVARNHRQ
jgi:hypothetical protein